MAGPLGEKSHLPAHSSSWSIPAKKIRKQVASPGSFSLCSSWRTSVCERVGGGVSYREASLSRTETKMCRVRPRPTTGYVVAKKCHPTPLRPFTGTPYPGGQSRAALLRRARAPFHEGRAEARCVGRRWFSLLGRPERP